VFRTLSLETFKSFESATLPLSPFTLLVGANASGKSNVREAFRFLHGISRGYTLAEVVGEKWIEGGVRVWTGVRGGAPHIAQSGASSFCIEAGFSASSREASKMQNFTYRIEVAVGDGHNLRVQREHLWESGKYVYDTHPDGDARGSSGHMIKARIRKFGGGYPPDDSFLDDRPILSQIVSSDVATEATKRVARVAVDFLSSMVFLDLSPHAAREASPVGVKTLGDRGENLSSVLQEICSNRARKSQLTSWVRALTPMDAVDLTFQEDMNGRVLGQLVEESGDEVPLSAASDGTVRFLAMIAALLSPARPRFIFFEELENGIHPNRVYLLLDLINQSVSTSGSQIVATSHSPQLLVHAYRTENARPCLVYRSEGAGSKIVDVRSSREMRAVLDGSDIASLMAAGWFEDVVEFLNPEEEGEIIAR
jgi:predicted ATPase